MVCLHYRVESNVVLGDLCTTEGAKKCQCDSRRLNQSRYERRRLSLRDVPANRFLMAYAGRCHATYVSDVDRILTIVALLVLGVWSND